MQRYFDLKVGFKCNNDCVHCVITDKKDTEDLTTQEIKNAIDNLDENHIVGFTGGEATIRDDFLELLRYAKESGHDTSLQTNGSMLHDDEFAKEASKYLDTCLIAIHSHIPEIHNSIVRCREQLQMYERTIGGFKNLIKYGVNTRTQTVISRLNVKDLPETYDFIQSVSPGIYMNLTFPHPNGAALRNANIVVPRYSEIKPYIQKILSKWARYLSVEAIPMCYLYPYHNDVDYYLDGDIMKEGLKVQTGLDPANKSDGEFFDENGIIEDYNLANRSERRKGPFCKYCSFKDRCPGVWKEYIMIHGRHLDLFPIVKKDV